MGFFFLSGDISSSAHDSAGIPLEPHSLLTTCCCYREEERKSRRNERDTAAARMKVCFASLKEEELRPFFASSSFRLQLEEASVSLSSFLNVQQPSWGLSCVTEEGRTSALCFCPNRSDGFRRSPQLGGLVCL